MKYKIKQIVFNPGSLSCIHVHLEGDIEMIIDINSSELMFVGDIKLVKEVKSSE